MRRVSGVEAISSAGAGERWYRADVPSQIETVGVAIDRVDWSGDDVGDGYFGVVIFPRWSLPRTSLE